MKRFMLTLATVMILALTVSASTSMGPRHPRAPRHNHSLRYHRPHLRTCPACRFYARHHVAPRRVVAPPPPRHRVAPMPKHHRHPRAVRSARRAYHRR